jgi:hypothetical protein
MRRSSMNRTTFVTAVLAGLLVGALRGQDAPPVPAPNPVDALVTAMVAADGELTAARLELRTLANLPGELVVRTEGVLHVLRGTQPGIRSTFTYRADDGVEGRVESAQTATGIHQFSDDPVFGELFVHIPPAVVADLEWAGQVLEQDHLPGMADRRATSPLGIGMLVELRRTFDFAIDASRQSRGQDAGTWLVGKPKSGLAADDPALPVADRVEAFVRTSDRVLVELVMKQGDLVLQQVEVIAFERLATVAPKVFVVDGRGQRLREAKDHLPLWEQIEDACKKAEARLQEQGEKLPEAERAQFEVRRPSRRR